MINLNFKYSFVIFTYVVLFVLVVLSYIAIVPEEEIPILKNDDEIFKVVENELVENENSVYEILEKKNLKKNIEDIIEKEVNLNVKDKEKNLKDKFRLQFASFKDRSKSEKIAKKIKSEFFNYNNDELLIRKITLKSDEIFYRVVSNEFYEYKNAKKMCALIKKKFQCLIVKETE